jgi:LysM repeat protein
MRDACRSCPTLRATSAPTTTPDVLVIIETPIPTSTPFVYTVERGDTLSGIAEKFKVSLDALRAANPDLKTSILSIGQTLFIPDPSSPSPPPRRLHLCLLPSPRQSATPQRTRDCGASRSSKTTADDYLENVSAQITLLDADGNAVASETAFALLDVIAPNSSLPVYVFFPNISVSMNPQVQVLSAMTTADRFTCLLCWKTPLPRLRGMASCATQRTNSFAIGIRRRNPDLGRGGGVR